MGWDYKNEKEWLTFTESISTDITDSNLKVLHISWNVELIWFPIK